MRDPNPIDAIHAMQSRSEELLLEVIRERMQSSYERAIEFEPIDDLDDDESKGRRAGWVDAWDDAFARLTQIIEEHNEHNEWRLRGGRA